MFINYYFSSDSISSCEKLFKVSKKGRRVTKFPYKHTFWNPLSQLLRLYMFLKVGGKEIDREIK